MCRSECSLVRSLPASNARERTRLVHSFPGRLAFRSRRRRFILRSIVGPSLAAPVRTQEDVYDTLSGSGRSRGAHLGVKNYSAVPGMRLPPIGKIDGSWFVVGKHAAGRNSPLGIIAITFNFIFARRASSSSSCRPFAAAANSA